MTTIEKKYNALSIFTNELLQSDIKNYIGKIILFGSLLKKKANKDSDIDIIVFGTDNLEKIRDTCAEISLDIMLETHESIEPLIYCIDKLKNPCSYFLYHVTKTGKEVYKMNEKELKKEEMKGYLELTIEYIEIAELRSSKSYRGMIDAAYNAAELCVKGLLLAKMDDIPSTHRGVVDKIGEVYIKHGLISKDIGKTIRKTLEYRNNARYEWHAIINREMADETLSLAKQLSTILESTIKQIK